MSHPIIRNESTTNWGMWYAMTPLLLVWAAACDEPASEGASVQTQPDPLVFEQDDRQEPYLYEDPAWAEFAKTATAAIMLRTTLEPSSPDNVPVNAPTLATNPKYKVCPDEPYADQKTGGFCSATLIAPDLMLTAGHCLAKVACDQIAFVFNYAMENETDLAQITQDDVYLCEEYVVEKYEHALDYAVVRLERQVIGRTPAQIKPGYAPIGISTQVVIAGYPSGLPLKIADNARVTSNRAELLDYFNTDLDAFKGNSGSGVFLEDTKELVGVLVRTHAGSDYIFGEDDCRVTLTVDSDFFAKAAASYVARPVHELCELDNAYDFCHCGDGVCDTGLSERTDTCPADCGTVCGDGACNGQESIDSCYSDCGVCGDGHCDEVERLEQTCCVDCGNESDTVCSGITGAPHPALGDVNFDGNVNTTDALLVAQDYVGKEVTIDTQVADVNCDGTIDIVDSLLIAKYYVGGLDDFECHGVADVAVGKKHVCAVSNGGEVSCWGSGEQGMTGYAQTTNIGDDELAGSLGSVFVGGEVKQVAAAAVNTCALLTSGSVRCWGGDRIPQLGYSLEQEYGEGLGDDEHPAVAGDLTVGRPVVQIAAGLAHFCALTDVGTVRCWGVNMLGQLGLGHMFTTPYFPPIEIGDTPIGPSPVVQLAAGENNTCVLTEAGDVLCWGQNTSGALGYGNTENIGDNETPEEIGPVALSGKAIQVETGYDHTCALLENGTAQCWGGNTYGQLGLGHTRDIGDDETPAENGEVVQFPGERIVQLAAGANVTCALLDSGTVRCWGQAANGKLGNLSQEDIGDDELPDTSPAVALGGSAVAINAKQENVCAILDTGNLRCWGNNADGQLGIGSTDTIGDDEAPASIPPMAPF